jgi:hypothetical protein
MIVTEDRKAAQAPACDMADTVQLLRSMAIRGLARMYRPDDHVFAFRLRRHDGKDVLEGTSRRYTAIALIGLAEEAEDVATSVLAGEHAGDVCGRLIEGVEHSEDLGEVALTAWAARRLGHPNAGRAIEQLKRMDPVGGSFPTVEVSWSLTALVVDGSKATDPALAEGIARRLLSSFNPRSCLFPHWPEGAAKPWLRSHVTCFADFVYPVQALSHFHMAVGSDQAIKAAQRCADQICRLQGSAGQWWWHYDVRTGRVIEGYPVYSVHQDAMAPMALLALRQATSHDYSDAIWRGLQWLADPPEATDPLIDVQADVIWRKVARHEPSKLVRGVQAAASRLHPALRVPGLDTLLPPGCVDYESRPYCMGWILHALRIRGEARHDTGGGASGLG